MGRKQKEGGITRTSFTLTMEQFRLLGLHTANSGFNSCSEFVGWLIDNFDASTDPIKEAKNIQSKMDTLKEQQDELKEKMAETLKRMEYKGLREKSRKKGIDEAIEVLVRKITEGCPVEQIESIARVRALRLNIDPFELIYRATKEVKNSGERKITKD